MLSDITPTYREVNGNEMEQNMEIERKLGLNGSFIIGISGN